MTPSLSAEGVGIEFGGLKALCGFNLSINQGDLFGLIEAAALNKARRGRRHDAVQLYWSARKLREDAALPLAPTFDSKLQASLLDSGCDLEVDRGELLGMEEALELAVS